MSDTGTVSEVPQAWLLFKILFYLIHGMFCLVVKMLVKYKIELQPDRTETPYMIGAYPVPVCVIGAHDNSRLHQPIDLHFCIGKNFRLSQA